MEAIQSQRLEKSYQVQKILLLSTIVYKCLDYVQSYVGLLTSSHTFVIVTDNI